MVHIDQADVCRGRRTVLVLGKSRVYDGFQDVCTRGDTCCWEGSGRVLHPWVPSGEREFGFRYHDLDIYACALAESDIV